MDYTEALEHLTTKFGMPDLTAHNVLVVAFHGQTAGFGGSQSPHRVTYNQQDGYRVLADGYVIPVA